VRWPPSPSGFFTLCARSRQNLFFRFPEAHRGNARAKKKKLEYNTPGSRVISDLSTNVACGCLTSQIGRDVVFPTKCGRTQKCCFAFPNAATHIDPQTCAHNPPQPAVTQGKKNATLRGKKKPEKNIFLAKPHVSGATDAGKQCHRCLLKAHACADESGP
jgi:hypothetical protein